MLERWIHTFLSLSASRYSPASAPTSSSSCAVGEGLRGARGWLSTV